MPVSKKMVAVLFLVLTFSIFVANVSNIISVNIEALKDNGSQARHGWTANSGVSDGTGASMGDTSENLMWFLQVTDTHISIFHDPTRMTDLHDFCQHTVPSIKPAVVLASGDLTDAKAENNMGSSQYEQEWINYRQVLDKCKLENRTVWLDIRGNHDNFNIPDNKSSLNYYRQYSQQGQKFPRSYMHQLRRGDALYSFVALDACLEPGPRRPFNFVGMLNQQEASHVKRLLQDVKSSGSNYTVWFGHYPTSCILSQGPDKVRNIISSEQSSLAYLCGHFHTFGGTVPHMYTLQKAGFLELELGDWKDNRLFRLLAIDHGLLSFTDLSHGEWPAILVTNPKHALYQIPGREPAHFIGTSSHIRILAFSLDDVKSVMVKLNNGDWQEASQKDGPLFVLAWNPNEYATGLHYIHVTVEDSAGRSRTITQPFSTDGTRISFSLLPRIVLMSNISVIFQILFGVMLVVCVVPLCIIKYLHSLALSCKISRPRLKVRCLQLWLRRLWVLASVDRIFYPLTLYAIYLTFGPWSIGAVIEGYTGVIFAWGIIINGSYLPGSFTYAYGFLQLLVIHFPLTLFLSCYLHTRLQDLIDSRQKPVSRTYHWFCQLSIALLILLQMVFAYFFWLAYGTMAFLLGPLRTWSVILSVVLWYLTITLPDNCLKEAVEVWGTQKSKEASHSTVIESQFSTVNPAAN